MLTCSPRPFLLGVLLLAGGCSTAEKWPTPKNTTDVVLQDDRRSLITTVTLGDALHLILPPPRQPNTQWQMLMMNTVNLRQMTDLKPVPDRPGSQDISFQAIKTTARTMLQFAAVDPSATTSKPSDMFSISVGIKMPAASVPAAAR
jgi:hypothetical protein